VCGICGIAYEDRGRRVSSEALAAMNAALAHRGPDEAGEWLGGHVGLAMRRLSILDIEGGRQPMQNESGTVQLVFNGEVYNFRELRDDLEDAGHVFQSHADTEVIVHGYEEWGDDVLERLNGMFAFALYDVERDRLLVARDRLGIKPLYYCHREGVLVFASELGALLRSGLARGAMNPAAVDAFFAFLYIPSPDTIYADARKLRAGEKLVFERGRLEAECYWRFQIAPKKSWGLASAAGVYRALLQDSVRLRRISDVPLGAFLSGGLDSSSVVAMLSQMGAEPVKTFTVGFEDAYVNELAYARIAANHFGTDHTEAILTPDMVEVAGALAGHFGEPFADSSAVPTWLVSKVARESVTVALSGDGGDELFAGYTWLHRTRNVAAYRWAPETLRRLLGAALRAAPDSPQAGKLRRFNAGARRASPTTCAPPCMRPTWPTALPRPDSTASCCTWPRPRGCRTTTRCSTRTRSCICPTTSSPRLTG